MSETRMLRLFKLSNRNGTNYVALPWDECAPAASLSSILAECEDLVAGKFGRAPDFATFEELGDVLLPAPPTTEIPQDD